MKTVLIKKHYINGKTADFFGGFCILLLKTKIIKPRGDNMQNDTVSLLKECNSGIKMGVNSIEKVLPYVNDRNLKKNLNACKDEHATLGDETHKMLLKYNASTKDPHPVARVMSSMKTTGKMLVDRTDNTIADVMTDGCNMGVKSLNKYLTRYQKADQRAKNIAQRLIDIEENLTQNLRSYL